MRDRRDIVIQKIGEIKPQLEEEFGVQQIEFFGSVAVGEDTGASDVDLLVSFHRVPSLFEMGRLKKRIEEVLSMEVDLVTPEGCESARLPMPGAIRSQCRSACIARDPRDLLDEMIEELLQSRTTTTEGTC